MKTDYFDKAALQFANLMIEKIQQVEDNWQKPWITIAANTRNFLDVYKRQRLVSIRIYVTIIRTLPRCG